MVIMPKALKCVILTVVASLILCSCVCAQGSEFEDSTTIINVWLNGKQVEYDAKMSFGNIGNEPVFQLNDGQSYISKSGEPKLPSQILNVILPPNAYMDSIDYNLDAEYADIAGEWNVLPMPPAVTYDKDGKEIVIWPEASNIVDGYDADIYTLDAYWPAKEAVQMSAGMLRSYKLVELAVPLYRYNSVSGSLQKLVSADVDIAVAEKKEAGAKSVVAGNAVINERLSQLAINYSEAAGEYSESSASKAPNLNDTGYVIITTNSIKNASSKLSDFVAHKSQKYTVTVVTESDYGTGSGSTAAANIRSWLTANYTNTTYGNGGILYVLLIGDPRVNSSSVPMALGNNEFPTDYYYAELTGNWDRNNDGIYGADADNPEKYFEVYTGRIPYYGNISDTDHILQKTIDYENEADTEWRRNALLPMVPLDDSTQAYQMGEQIKYDSLEPYFITSTRIYHENYGLVPAPEYHLDDRYPATEWSENKYGMVIWQTHGWSQGGSEVMNSGDTGNLDDEYPSAVYQGSCMTGDPDATDNLGYSLMKNGAIGTVAASRNGLYWVGQTNFTNTNSVGGIGYQYAKRIAEGKALGRAIYESKENLGFWLQNYYVYNFYGDPSVVVYEDQPDFGVGPTHGVHYSMVYGGNVSDAQDISLVNNSTTAMDWTISKGGADWYDVSMASGRLYGNSNMNIELSLNGNASNISVGTHTDTIVIRNTTTGEVIERPVILVVGPNKKIAHWTMNETSGTVVTDISGNGRNGATVNTDFSTAAATGKFDGGMLFDGVDDYVDVPGFSEDMSGLTISVWINPYNWDGNRRLLQKGGDGSEFRLLRERGAMVFEIGSNRLSVASVPGVNVWTHVVAVYDGSEMRLYYNKDLIGTRNRTGTVPTSGNTLYVGSKNDESASGDLFYGIMDEIQIFNYAKDEAGIEALYEGSNMPEVISPYHGAGNVFLTTELKWQMGLTATLNDVYFGTDYDSVSNAIPSSSEYKGRQLPASYSSVNLIMNSDYYWRVDQVDSSGVVTKGPVWKFTTGNGTGGITRDVWYGISGNYLSDLKNDSDYPDNPDDTAIMPSLEGPRDDRDDYGARLYGFLIPPVTGNYTFWIASDDYSELWLSSDSDAANVSKIAYINGYTSYQEWNKYSSQESSSVYLEAGVPYYVEVLHKEGGGGDHVSVAFSGPGFARKVVPGECVMPYSDNYNWGPKFTSDYLVGAVAREGDENYHSSIASEVWSVANSSVTFSKTAGPEWLTIEADGSYHGVTSDANAGMNLFEVTATDSSGLSATAILQIKVADMYTGEKGMEDFAMFAGDWMNDGTDETGADLLANSQVDIADMEVFAANWLMEAAEGPTELYLSFDSDASDAIGGYVGVLNNGASITNTDVRPGLGDGALSLDGVDDNVVISGYAGVLGTSSRTCMAWVKTTVQKSCAIASWGVAAVGENWVFRINPDGSFGVGIYGGYVHSNNSVNDGQWHHLALVLNEASNPDLSDVTLYIDGKNADSYMSNPTAVNTGTGSDLTIGSYNHTNASNFDGLIDELRIFDYALTKEDVEKFAGKDIELELQLDDNAGTIAVDSSDNSRDGIAMNNPTWANDGVTNGAMHLDGVDDYIEVPYVINPADGPFTAMLWIKGGGPDQEIISQCDGEGVGRVWLYIDSSTKKLSTYISGAKHRALQSNLVWDDYSDDWHHVCLVWDGYRRYLYLDGEVVAADSSDITRPESSNGKLYIGTHKNLGSQNYFNGAMDDVRIYSRGLSPDEIAELVN